MVGTGVETSFTIFPAICNSFIRGCEHFRNIPISCKVSFRLPGNLFSPSMEFFFHVWKKNSMHGKKFPRMEMLDEGLHCSNPEVRIRKKMQPKFEAAVRTLMIRASKRALT